VKGIIISIVTTAAVLANSAALALSMPLEEYNLVVAGDYTHQGGSVWGKTLIGGDLLGGASEFAVTVPRTTEVDSLQVVGDITASHVKVKSGNLVHAGAIGNYTNIELHTAGASIIHDTSLTIDAEVDSLKQASQTYTGLQSNTTFSGGAFSFGGGADVAVIDIDATDLFQQNTNFSFSDVSAESLIINIAGTDVSTGSAYNFPGFDLQGSNGLGASNILWNFYEAENLHIGSPMVGSILAIYADVTLMGTLDGSMAAGSLLTQRQIHDYTFDDNVNPVNPVPLPGSTLLFGTGLLLFSVQQIRRKKKA